MYEVQTKPKLHIKCRDNTLAVLSRAEKIIRAHNELCITERICKMKVDAINSENFYKALEVIGEHVEIIDELGDAHENT